MINPFMGRVEGATLPSAGKRLTHGTDEQQYIWERMLRSDANLLIEARAGSGKSAVCREGQHRLLEQDPGLAIRYAVFNKSNADEFRSSCPPGVDVGTLHAFGFGAIRKAFQSSLEKNKSYLILDQLPNAGKVPRYLRRPIAQLVSQAKNQAIIPPPTGDCCDEIQASLTRLIDYYGINAYSQPATVAEVAQEVLSRSAEMTELVDFDDMLWMAGLYRDQVEFPRCDVLFLDEVQDLNPAQFAMLPGLCRSGRVVAVGDRWQAIYAFRGADVESMDTLSGILQRKPNGMELGTLTVTWRCPRSHVNLARNYVNDIKAREGAAEGTIGNATEASAVSKYRPGDMVLSPTNAPLVGTALRLIQMRRKAFVRGRAIGDSLVSIVRACGEQRTIESLSLAVERWKNRELSRLCGKDGMEDVIEQVQDRAASVEAILSTCDSPGEVEGRITELFSESGPAGDCVLLSTIHRAKGLEAERVHLLEVPTRQAKTHWEAQQQINLRYVALTRSLDSLTFVQVEKKDEAKKL